VRCDQSSYMSEQQDHYSSISNQIDLPSKQHSHQTLIEPSNVNGPHHNKLLNENQHHDNDQEDIDIDPINQHLPTRSSLTDDQETLNENPLNAEEIQEPEISGPTNIINFQIDNHSHYTTYFHEQSDFKDYADSKIVARIPKLFTGKRFIS
jgi:hypothetical protein